MFVVVTVHYVVAHVFVAVEPVAYEAGPAQLLVCGVQAAVGDVMVVAVVIVVEVAAVFVVLLAVVVPVRVFVAVEFAA